MKTIKQLIQKLKDKGTIVSSDDCTVSEILYAEAHGSMWVDEDGFGYVYRKPINDKSKASTALTNHFVLRSEINDIIRSNIDCNLINISSFNCADLIIEHLKNKQ